MFKYLLTLLFSTIFLFNAYAQSATDTLIYYVKNNGNFVETKDESDYTLVILPETQAGKQKLYPVLAFYPDGKRKMIATSGLKSKKLSFEGTQMMFFPNGRRAAVTMYEKGDPVGEQVTYYPNGKLYTRKNFQKNKTLFIECRDSTGNVLTENGNGKWIEFDDNFININANGLVKDGLMNGEWNQIYGTATYKNGISRYRTNSVSLDYRNASIGGDIYIQRDSVSLYKESLDTIEKFINENINYAILIKENALERQMYVGFFVEPNGSTTGYSAFFSPSKTVTDELIRVAKLSAPWKPTSNKRTPVIIPVYLAADEPAYDPIANKVSRKNIIMPEYPGGINEFSKFLERNISYPTVERNLKVTGKVLTRFSVEADGSITDIHVLNTPSIDLAEESLRIMRQSPGWAPGSIDSKPSRFSYTLPVNFSLKPQTLDTRTSAYLEGISLPKNKNIRDTLEKFIVNNIEEPLRAQIAGRQMYVEFSVEPDGSLTEIKVFGSPSEKLTAELIRLVKSSSPWARLYTKRKTAVLTIYFPKNGLKLFSDKITLNDSESNNKIFSSVETLPEFPGGKSAFSSFITKNIKYPGHEKQLYNKGRVYVSFVIEQDGSMSDLHIAGAPSMALSEEALRVMRQSPKWSPAYIGGKPVAGLFKTSFDFNFDYDSDAIQISSSGQAILSDSLFIRTPSGNAYIWPEVMPKFQGGIKGFSEYLNANIKYPKADRQNRAYGWVKLNFIVENDGSISNIECIQSPTKSLGEEAVRVMKLSPKWIPGSEKERKVRVMLNFSLRISFKNNAAFIIVNNP